MKILHVITSLDARSGGPSEAVRQLGTELISQGEHEVEVATLDAPGELWLADFPVPVHALGPGWGKYHYTPRLVPWLRQHAPAFDAVIVNGIWQFTSWGTWHALHGIGKPYFVFTHGMLDPWFKRHYPLKHLKKWLYWPWGDYRVLRDAEAVLFTSQEERQLARQSFWLYRCRERVVNYGTAAPGGEPSAQREEFFRRFPALRERRILLFLGRLHEKKGCDLLLHAFRKIAAAEVPSADDPRPLALVLAGPSATPAYQRTLEALAPAPASANAPLVLFPGMLSGDAKWGAFRSADAFVLPSHQENFGIAVAEALACGTPVLISNKVNIWREIEASGGGRVEADTLPGTENLLRGWLRTPFAERQQMRHRAQECFVQNFEVAAAARALVTALTEFLPPS